MNRRFYITDDEKQALDTDLMRQVQFISQNANNPFIGHRGRTKVYKDYILSTETYVIN